MFRARAGRTLPPLAPLRPPASNMPGRARTLFRISRAPEGDRGGMPGGAGGRGDKGGSCRLHCLIGVSRACVARGPGAAHSCIGAGHREGPLLAGRPVHKERTDGRTAPGQRAGGPQRPTARGRAQLGRDPEEAGPTLAVFRTAPGLFASIAAATEDQTGGIRSACPVGWSPRLLLIDSTKA